MQGLRSRHPAAGRRSEHVLGHDLEPGELNDQPDRAAAVELGPHPTALTADHGRRVLDDQLPLAAYHLGSKDLEAVQAEQPGSRRSTVLTHGPPCRRQTSASFARPQVLFWRSCPTVGNTPPTLHDEEPPKRGAPR